MAIEPPKIKRIQSQPAGGRGKEVGWQVVKATSGNWAWQIYFMPKATMTTLFLMLTGAKEKLTGAANSAVQLTVMWKRSAV